MTRLLLAAVVVLVAVAAADAIRPDGKERTLTLTDEDRSVFFQPVAYNIGKHGYQTQISGLLRRALVESDNAANDKLMRSIGGPKAVRDMIAAKNLGQIRF